MISRILGVLVVVGVLVPLPVAAQSFEVSAHIASSQWSEFDGTDIGGGARLTFKPAPMLGVDADLTWYPGDFPPDGPPFSGNRLEGFFGVTVGPRLAGFRPFVKAAAGFMKAGEAPAPFACIAIFPPPLGCKLAVGATLAAYELGGGVELDGPARTFIRADITDRILKYPGPTFDSNFEIQDEGFLGHALRFTLGAGLRF